MDLNFLDFEQPIAELDAKIKELIYLMRRKENEIIRTLGKSF